jgi:hypothetical protein
VAPVVAPPPASDLGTTGDAPDGRVTRKACKAGTLFTEGNHFWWFCLSNIRFFFFKPITQDELNMTYKQSMHQAHTTLKIDLVLDTRLHTLVAMEHCIPRRGDRMIITIQCIQQSQHAPQLHSGFTPFGWNVAFLVSEMLCITLE